MFKKLKDKLAEEVKSSPQRIQQFAQAAQAAVTSASSSISDITNNDLFSIGDNDGQQNRLPKHQSPTKSKSSFENVSLVAPESLQTNTECDEFSSLQLQDVTETLRQRKLSNSSFACDVSFRLPTYESPSMYHLQSDMEISASEADERGLSSGAISLDRVTKEQIYGAYRRTQDRYTKYRTQYADLARHYKLLERENAKAKSVLVETQDKALRRISELREQCALEQSAKAHLEKALRVEIEEKNLKIETLYTKIDLLQNNPDAVTSESTANNIKVEENVKPINLLDDGDNNIKQAELTNEIISLNNKSEKLEQLVNKYKESLKTTKEKNNLLTYEMQIILNELENKNKEIGKLKIASEKLIATDNEIQELNKLNEDLQNQINLLSFNKSRDMSTHESDLQKARDENAHLKSQIEVFIKREEEYAISLAENKQSIHKELENKENEIKTLKNSLSASLKEVQSLNIVLSDYKNSISLLEEEQSKLVSEVNELQSARSKINSLETELQTLCQECQALENVKTKGDEEYKCLQLQLKQETAEKLAMIDRNDYLQNKNMQLTEENSKKSLQLTAIETELQALKLEKVNSSEELLDKTKLLNEIDIWKNKYNVLESEIQEERVELVKLQTEIEKLLSNHELVQMQNTELNGMIADLKSENYKLESKVINCKTLHLNCQGLVDQVQCLKQCLVVITKEIKKMQRNNTSDVYKMTAHLNTLFEKLYAKELQNIESASKSKSNTEIELNQITEKYSNVSNQLGIMRDQYNKKVMDIQTLENEIKLNHENIHNMSTQYENNVLEINNLKKDKENLSKLMEDSSDKLQQLQNTLETNKKELVTIKTENEKLFETLKTVENDNVFLKKEADTLRKNIDEMTLSLESTRNENDILHKKTEDSDVQTQITDRLKETVRVLEHEKISLNTEIETLKTNLNELRTELETIKNDNDILRNKFIDSEDNKQSIRSLEENIRVLEHAKTSLSIEAETLRTKYNHISTAFETVKKENDVLVKKTQDSEVKNQVISRLDEEIKALTEENITLKSQCEKNTENLTGLEFELNDIRRSHTDIEIEKERLNSIIEQMEIKQSTASQSDRQQTESRNEPNDVDVVIEDSEELQTTKSKSALIQLTSESNIINSENISLKEENRRLRSDIAGLQTYLTNISKENSILNDKLREYIASSEHLPYQNEDQPRNSANSCVQIEDLIRENNLLVEENLELKDQLNSQSYKLSETKPGDKSEYNTLKEKHDHLLNTNQNMEGRLRDLEQMNRSMNSNMSQVQENNEKLRKTNEKLERRLDEALVSLRHLHSLHENTELEYLRNILYEYLTGTGTHSLTLAKVLAAVVKFDDNQTKEVIQKEKERQGLLRQLGLI